MVLNQTEGHQSLNTILAQLHTIYSLENGYSISDCVVNLTSFNLVLGGVYSNNAVMLSTATDRYTYHGKVNEVALPTNLTRISNSDYEIEVIGPSVPLSPTTAAVIISTTAVIQTDFASSISVTRDNQLINQWTSSESYDVTYASSETTLNPNYTCVSGSDLSESVSIIQSGSNTLPTWVSWDSPSSSLRYIASCTTGTGDYIFDLQTMVNSDSTHLFTKTITLSLNNSNL